MHFGSSFLSEIILLWMREWHMFLSLWFVCLLSIFFCFLFCLKGKKGNWGISLVFRILINAVSTWVSYSTAPALYYINYIFLVFILNASLYKFEKKTVVSQVYTEWYPDSYMLILIRWCSYILILTQWFWHRPEGRVLISYVLMQNK